MAYLRTEYGTLEAALIIKGPFTRRQDLRASCNTTNILGSFSLRTQMHGRKGIKNLKEKKKRGSLQA